MVTYWLLNSISKDTVDKFLYTCFAKKLWDEIKDRIEESNGSLLYQLKREISSFTYANLNVVVYFTKLKKTTGCIKLVKTSSNVHLRSSVILTMGID